VSGSDELLESVGGNNKIESIKRSFQMGKLGSNSGELWLRPRMVRHLAGSPSPVAIQDVKGRFE
jgi:hypothetical protein